MSEALQIQQEILSYLEAHRDRYLDAIRTLARIPAPSNHEELRAQWCKQHLEELGATGVYIDDALNVIFPYGVEEGANDLCAILGHTDVVFPDTEPLPFHEENGRFYAPGIGDDTTNAVAVMEMAAMAIDLKLKPKTGILFVLNSGEEGLGNLKGTKQLMREATAPVTELTALDAHFPEVVTEAVGSVRYRISVHTQGGHSWKNWGVPNAIERLSRVVCAMYDLPRPTEARTTCNVGLIEGGTTVNSIASEASCLCEFRSTSESCLQEMDEKLRDLVARADARDDMDVQIAVIGRRPATGDVNETAERRLTRRCDDAIQAVLGVRAHHVSSSTDANVPLSLGVPAVCVGTITGGLPHTRDEWIRKASLEQGVAVALLLMMAHVVEDE